MKRFLDDFIKGSTPMLCNMVMAGFGAALAMALPTVVRFIARQFLAYWSWIAAARGQKVNGTRTSSATDMKPTVQNETFFPFWGHQPRFFPGDLPFPGRQNFQGGIHPAGKEFSFLRSKNLICETAGWIAIL
ncbi:MAG TPA: hypothetical protein VMV04_13105 [Thermodesulfobacteriota bacterium]|nr:hypothetical protein [Thermodesulfobacteriota bacterium]